MKKIFPILTILTVVALVVCHREEVGWISIQSNPGGVTVYLDGKSTRQITNCTLKAAADTIHRILLRLPDYEELETELYLPKGETCIVYFILFNEVKIKWKYKPQDYVYSNVTLDPNGTILFSSYVHGGPLGAYLYALNPDGTLKWRFYIGGAVEAGPLSCEDRTVYFVSDDTARTYSYLYALREDGSLKWRHRLPNEKSATGMTLSSRGNLYLLCFDGTIYSFTKQGGIIWSRRYHKGLIDIENLSVANDGTIYTSATYKNNDNYVLALNPDGSLKWRYHTEYNSANGGPAIDGDGTIYFPTDGGIYALFPDGRLKWRYETRGDALEPAIGNSGTIYFVTTVVADENYCYALNPDGSLKWKYKIMSPQAPSIGSDESIYFATYNEGIVVLSPDGTFKKRYPASSSSYSPVIADDGTIYVRDGDYLYAYVCDSRGLANSPWPKYRHDNQNTGNAAWPIR